MGLRDALIGLFGANPLGDAIDWEAHHIIPISIFEEFDEFLDRIGLDLNDAWNGVPLPNDALHAEGLNLPRHTNHIAEYTDLFRNQLNAIDGAVMSGFLSAELARAEVMALADNIRSGLAPSMDFVNGAFTFDANATPSLFLTETDLIANSLGGDDVRSFINDAIANVDNSNLRLIDPARIIAIDAVSQFQRFAFNDGAVQRLSQADFDRIEADIGKFVDAFNNSDVSNALNDLDFYNSDAFRDAARTLDALSPVLSKLGVFGDLISVFINGAAAYQALTEGNYEEAAGHVGALVGDLLGGFLAGMAAYNVFLPALGLIGGAPGAFALLGVVLLFGYLGAELSEDLLRDLFTDLYAVLDAFFTEGLEAAFELALERFDPLVIDLDGDGVNTTSVEGSNVTFDIDNNGTEETVGWFEAEDGILFHDWQGTLDANGNPIGDGQAQNRSELFATFEELSRHDLNGDGVLDATDVVEGATLTGDFDGDGDLETIHVGWDQLRVWVDANQNGNVDEGEVNTLEELGIESIDLNAEELAIENNGNLINSQSTVTFADGSTQVINGIDLARDTIDQSYEQQIAALDLSPEHLSSRLDVFTLPQMQGSGNVPHLLIAALGNDDILNAWRGVTNHDGQDVNEFRSLVEDLLFTWAGTSETNEAFRGRISTQMLEAYEAFLGQTLAVPIAGLINDNVFTTPQANFLADGWNNFLNAISLRFMVQMEAFNSDGLLTYDFTTDTFAGDWTGFLEAFEAQYRDADSTHEEQNAARDVLLSVLGVTQGSNDAEASSAAGRIDDFLKEIDVYQPAPGFFDDFVVGFPESPIEGEEAFGSSSGVDGGGNYVGSAGSGAAIPPGYIIPPGNQDDSNDNTLTASLGSDGQGTDRIMLGGIGNDLYVVNVLAEVGDSGTASQEYTDDISQVMIYDVDGDAFDVLHLPQFESLEFSRDQQHLYITNIHTGSQIMVVNQFAATASGVNFILLGDIPEGSIGNIGFEAIATSGNGSGGSGGTSTGKNEDPFVDAESHENIWDYADIIAAAWYRGGVGNDYIQGSAEDETFHGGLGHDVIVGGSGNDTYIYGAGDGNDVIIDNNATVLEETEDTLRLTDISSDEVTLGRDGDDLIVLINTTGQAITVQNQFLLSSSQLRGIERLEFADGVVWNREDIADAADVRGDDQVNTLIGSGEDDTFISGAGNDALIGGRGNDTYIYASGDGIDTISDISPVGPDDFDRIILIDLNREDVEIIREQSTSRELIGQDLDLLSTTQNLVIRDLATGQILRVIDQFGGPSSLNYGIEEIVFADGSTMGRDEILAAAVFRGTFGDDEIRASEEADRIIGDTGDDTLRGQGGDDTYLYASGDGNDTILDNGSTGDRFNDTLQFVDLNLNDVSISRSAMDLFVADLTTGQRIAVEGHFTSESLGTGIESIVFAGGQSLDRSQIEAAAIFTGTDGGDQIVGTSTSNTFDGGTGDDVLSGLSGNDTYVYASGDGFDTIIDNPTTGDRFNDTLRLVDLNQDEVELQRIGLDLVAFDTSTGQSITIQGHFQSDTLGTGLESIVFADGSTLDRATIQQKAILTGTSGADTIAGTNASETFDGNEGDDVMNGGRGSDTYLYSLGDGSDVINDASFFGVDDTDVLRLRDLNSNQVSLERSGNDLLIVNGIDGSVITIAGHYSIVSRNTGLEEIQFANGETWTRDQFDDLLNAPRVVSFIDPQASNEDEAISLTIPEGTFSDPNGLALQYSATLSDGAALPSWLVFDEDTLSFAGTPPQDFNGSLTVELTASNGTQDANLVFDLVINPINDAPSQITPLQNQATAEDEAVLFALPDNVFMDVEGEAISLTAMLGDGSPLPVWLNFDPDAGAFAGTPPQDFNDDLEIVVTASDGELTTSDTFLLQITPVNDAPVVVTSLNDQSSPEEEAVSFAIPADAFSDVDGDNLALAAILADGANLPSWLSFDEETGTFSGTPPQNFNGDLEIIVTASDGELTTSDTFLLQIDSVNDAPIVATPLTDQSSPEDQAVSFALPSDAFDDVDGDELILSATLASGAPLPSWLSFNAEVGAFEGTSPANFNGTIEVLVTASDGAISIGSSFLLTIEAMNDAPIVLNPIGDQSGAEDEAISFTIDSDTFSDIDGDALSLSATLADGSALPDWLAFDAANGSFSGTPPQDFNGLLNLTVTGSDGDLTVSDNFVLEFTPVNDAPIVATPLSDQSSPEDASVSFALPADAFSDVDGDALTLTATSVGGTALPLWLAFDAEAGTFTGTPPANFNGLLEITVTASDGEFEKSDTFSLDIAPVNDAPELQTQLSDQTSNEDEAVSFALPAGAFADVDGDTLTHVARLASGAALPLWLTFDAIAGTFTGTPPQDFNGVLEIEVTASDGDLVASDVFTLTILALNDAPIVAIPLADQSSNEDEAVSFTLPEGAFADVDGDALTLSATLADGSPLPSWLVFDAAAQTFTGTPPENFNTSFLGAIAISVTASDGEAEASQSFLLEIAPVNDGPQAEDDGIFNTVQGNSTTILDGDLLANDFDADGDELTIETISGAGNGTVALNADGNIVYTPDSGFIGEDTFIYTVTDGEASDTATVTINVAEDDTVPDGAIVGSDGSDILIGDNGDDTILANDGNDIILGLGGNDTISGGAGNDIVFGGRGADTINGDAGNDLLFGNQGGDDINGGSGNDIIFGDRGRDLITGGSGNDILFGGRGSDTFVFRSGDGRDVIADYSTGSRNSRFFSSGDQIAIDVDGIETFEDLIANATQDGRHVVLDMGNGDELILANTRLAALDRDAFTFF